MGQQEQCNDMAEPAQHGRLAPWLRRIAACALALTIGLGQAYAAEVTSGQGRGFATAEAFAGDGAAHASSAAKSEGFSSPTARAAQEAKVTVKVEEEGIGTAAWTRTVTRTKVNSRFISSVTRSQSYVIDEEGNRAIAKAVAKARAPNNGAGSITAKTSVDVTGNGVATADAGGSIGIGRHGVKVETWARTSAEVF